MKQVILESAPVFLPVCVAAGLGYATLLYKSKHPWSTALNRVLFLLRAVVTFLLAFFLMGPIVRQIQNEYDKPLFVLLQDNSRSIQETTDSLSRNALINTLTEAGNQLQAAGYETINRSFSGEGFDNRFDGQGSDIHAALRDISNAYEGRNIAGVILPSDGIYTSGLSPLFGNYPFPVYTIGVGDTTVRADLMIKNLVYNKIAYEGNKFPLRVELTSRGLSDDKVKVSLIHKGRVVEQQIRPVTSDGYIQLEFQPLATEKGIQRWDIDVEQKPEEKNIKNNRASVFIEVVEGRKKILLVAAAPHPDIKAIRAVVEQNSNFEFMLHIPGISETEQKNLLPENTDLVIFHQVPDLRGRMRDLFQRYVKSKTSIWLMIGAQSDLNQIALQQLPLAFEQLPRQFDEVTPVVNSAFTSFTISTEAVSVFSGYPPVQVHFGRIQTPPTAVTLLQQRVGSLTTDKPLLYIHQEDARKVGVMLGEGMWRWRLHEFSRTEKSGGFDELIGKLLQFLTSEEDKRKFRSYPVFQQFNDTEPVIFESQVYNDIYEPVYGNTITLELTSEQGVKQRYSYTISPGNTRYPIGGLPEGVYRYSSSTELNGARETVSGQFLVVAQQLELQNLTADFDLLRRLSRQTGGMFVTVNQWDQLQSKLSQTEAKSIIRTAERYDSVINLKWIFFLLLLLISAEWFLRKYFGSY